MNNETTKNLIYLDRNEYAYPVSPLVAETLKNFDPQDLCTYTRCFQDGIKSELSAYIGNLYNISETNVIIGYGGEDILKSVIHYFLAGGNKLKILIPTYSWWYYKSIADEVDGQTISYPLYENGDRFSYDIAEIKRIAQEEKPTMLLLASPNNPTGNSLTHAEIEEIIESVPKQTIVIIDEAYTSFANKDITYISKLIEKYPNLLIIRTLSKFYGLPGLRLGYAFMGNSLESFAKYNTMYLGYNKLVEKLAIAAFESTDYSNKNAEIMQKDKKLYKDELSGIKGFKVYESDANFVLVKYPAELKEKLQEELLKNNIVVKFMNEEGLRTHMRITLGTHDINEKVISIIKSVGLAN